MKKQYQIDKQRAVQSCRRLAAQDDQNVQLVIPLREVVELVQRGLMNLALHAFKEVAEEVMDYEVAASVGPKNRQWVSLKSGRFPGGLPPRQAVRDALPKTGRDRDFTGGIPTNLSPSRRQSRRNPNNPVK